MNIVSKGSTALISSSVKNRATVARSVFDVGTTVFLEYGPSDYVFDIVLDCIDKAQIPEQLWPGVRIKIEGELVPREYWKRVKPKPGAHVLVYVDIHGGGGDGGKQILAAVAVLAITIAAPYLAAAIPGMATVIGGVTTLTTTGKVVAAGISLIGSMAVSAIFTPGRPPSPEGAPTPYFITGTQNQASPYGAVPQLFGRYRMTPLYAAIPNAIPQFDTTELHLLFDCGYGRIDISDIRIGDQSVDDLDSVVYAIHQDFVAGQALTYYTNEIEVVQLSMEVPQDDPDAWASASSTPNSVRVMLDFMFPAGLYHVSSDGDQNGNTQTLHIQYRATGGGGAWQNIASRLNSASLETVSVDGAYIVITGKYLGAFSITLDFSLSAIDQWEFQVRAIDASNERSRFGLVIWTGIRTRRTRAPIAPKKPRTILEMVIKGSQELANNIEQITFVGYSYLRRAMPSGTISNVKYLSRNPADAFLEVLSGPANPKPLATNKIDIPTIARWRAFCAAIDPVTGLPRYQIDVIVNSFSTVWNMLTAIASVARAIPTIRDGKISVAWDDPINDTPVQVFTPRNVQSFQSEHKYIDHPHAIRCKFVDPNLDWQQNEFAVYDDGYNANNATRYEEMDFWGATERGQIFRDARYIIAQGWLRPETYSIDVDVEHIACTRGDLVRIAFDEALIGGKPARIVSVTRNAADSIQVTLDEQIPMVPGYAMMHRNMNGAQRKYVIEDVIDTYTCTLGDVAGVQQGAMVVIGPTDLVTRDCYVQSISPRSEFEATLTLVDWAPAIYTSDTEPIPDYEPGLVNFDPGFPPKIVRLTASQKVVYIYRYPNASITLHWELDAGSMPGSFAVWYLDAGTWQNIGIFQGSNCELQRDWYLWTRSEDGQTYKWGGFVGQTLTFRVQPISIYGNRGNLKNAMQVSITLEQDKTPPANVTRLNATIRERTVFLTWPEVKDADVIGYQIRYAASATRQWNQMVQVAQTMTHDTLQVELPGRNGRYAIKAVDSTGNRSVDAAYAWVQTTWLNDYNVMEEVDNGIDFGGWHGSFSQTVVGTLGSKTGMILTGDAGPIDPVELTWFAAETGTPATMPSGWTAASTLLPPGRTPAPKYKNGAVSEIDVPDIVFTSIGEVIFNDIIDLGAYNERIRIVSKVTADGVATADDEFNDNSDLWNVNVYVSSSDRTAVLETWMKLNDGTGKIPVDYNGDGIVDKAIPHIWDTDNLPWSDWTPFHVADLEGRLFRFKIDLVSLREDVTPVVRNVEITLDVPDRVVNGTNVLGATPINVVYAGAFVETPSIGYSVGGLDSTDTVQISNSTATGFRMTLTQGAGGSTVNTARVDWIARGYGRIR